MKRFLNGIFPEYLARRYIEKETLKIF